MSEKNNGFKKIMGDKGSRKFLIFIGILIVAIVGIIVVNSGPDETGVNSQIRKAPSVSDKETALGVGEVNENYERALREADRQRIEAAKGEGKSVIPSIIGSDTEKNDAIEIEANLPEVNVLRPAIGQPAQKAKPVNSIAIPQPKEKNELRRPQTTTVQTTVQSAPPPVVEKVYVERPAPQTNEAIRDAYIRQMTRIMGGMDYVAGDSQTYDFSPPPVEPSETQDVAGVYGNEASLVGDPMSQQISFSADGPRTTNAAATDGTPGAGSAPAEDELPFDLPLTGHILYAHTITQADSDYPGPVVAKIVQGDLAGARVTGNFTRVNEKLMLEFSTISVTETMSGKMVNATYPIKAVAVDVQHAGTAVATSVDRHLFQRIAVTFATSFLGGMAEAITQSGQVTQDLDGSTTTTNPTLDADDKLLVATGTAAADVGDVMKEFYGNRETTVKVANGTPIGLLFLE